MISEKMLAVNATACLVMFGRVAHVCQKAARLMNTLDPGAGEARGSGVIVCGPHDPHQQIALKLSNWRFKQILHKLDCWPGLT